MACTEDPAFPEMWALVRRELELRDKMYRLRHQLSDASLAQMPEFELRLHVLKILGYVDAGDIVTVKVAPLFYETANKTTVNQLCGELLKRTYVIVCIYSDGLRNKIESIISRAEPGGVQPSQQPHQQMPFGLPAFTRIHNWGIEG